MAAVIRTTWGGIPNRSPVCLASSIPGVPRGKEEWGGGTLDTHVQGDVLVGLVYKQVVL